MMLFLTALDIDYVKLMCNFFMTHTTVECILRSTYKRNLSCNFACVGKKEVYVCVCVCVCVCVYFNSLTYITTLIAIFIM